MPNALKGMPRNSGIKTERWSVRFSSGSQHHGRSTEIRSSLNIEPLLLRIERSQLRWFGDVNRMFQERLPKQALLAKANG